jgi:hypothetical protein
MSENDKSYLTSKETKLELKIQDCELAHIRQFGHLKFTKKGNAFLYSKESVDSYLIKQSTKTKD